MTAGHPREANTIVLCDWNGTIVLDADRARASLNGVLVSHGLAAIDREGFAEVFHLPMESMFTRLGVPEPREAEAQWNQAMMARATTVRAGVNTLRRMREQGTRLGVVSAAAAAAVETDIAELGLGDIWHSLDAPSIDKVETLRSRRGKASDAFYLGDTAYDMRCALEAGYVPVAVSGGYADVATLRRAGAARVIDTLDQLPAAMELSASGSGIRRSIL